ncbi:hypothetical protein FQN57_006842 [Myotisia sp. PD_48]|nr:hypothetical protein FQN57_006842 [Myotisia sp. PD_48]
MASTDGIPPASITEGESLKRKRPAACVHCHQRKVRCDARTVGVPCSNCRTAGKLDCRIHEKKKRTAVRSLRHPVPIRCAPFPESNAPHAQASLTNPEPDSHRVPLSIADPSGHRDQSFPGYSGPAYPESANPDTSHDEDDGHEQDRQLVRLIDDDSNQRSIRRGVRVIYVGQDVSNLNFLLRQQHGDRDDEIYHFAANEISRKYIEGGFEQVPRDAFVLPDAELADELVDAYFKHVNPGCPIIEEEHFMSQYKGRDPSDAPSILLLQCVLLAGTHVSRSRPMRDTLKTAFFRRARVLFEARVERNRDILVQAALLLTWYSDPIDDDVAANAHYWVGVAGRIATGLGMHRNSGSSLMVPHDKRMWRRVWWILVQFDVMVSIQYGRPQAINLDDCDVEPLTPSDFEGCGDRVQSDYVIQFTELCCMISFIVRERFGLRVSPERRKAILSEADRALASWSIKLPDTARMANTNPESWPALLHLTYNNFLILLHRPHPRSDDYGPNDAEICSAAAGVIVSIFEELREKDRIQYLWASSVNALFTAMIQIRVELQFSNPVLAINALRRFDSTLSSLRSVAQYWHNAGTILRLFENSKRLQQDLETVKAKRPADKHKPGVEPHSKSSESSTPPMETPIPQPQLPGYWPKTQFGDNLHHFNKVDISAPINGAVDDEQITDPDWRQLFTFTDAQTGETFVPENLNDMEDEWRDLYLHDPGMNDYFQESTWLQG